MSEVVDRNTATNDKVLAGRRQSSKTILKTHPIDDREVDATLRGPPSVRLRRDRVSPEAATTMLKRADANGEKKTKRRSSKTHKHLEVDTNLDVDADNNETPRTELSTPPSTTTAASNRGSSDLRSPGQRKSPSAKVADDNAPLPDFITQTDKFGNAVTPRSSTAIQKARQEHPTGTIPQLHVGRDGKLSEEQERAAPVGNVDACTETLLDSIRIMCCCLLPDDTPTTQQRAAHFKNDSKVEEAIDEKPQLLPKLHPDDHGKKCLVLDLDETLVHSSFRAVPGADFVIPVQIEDVVHFVYVAKRPGVDEFLVEMAKHYEIIVYTASLNKYADPLLDLLDPNRVIRTRLFRESCVYYAGNYVKDLSLLSRDLSNTIIIDNSPSSYSFHPENAIDCSSFIDNPADRELEQIAAFLTGIKDCKDVRGICNQWRDWPNVNVDNQ